MPYPEFLSPRRRLTADVVREAFSVLSQSRYSPTYPVMSVAATPAARGSRVYFGVKVAGWLEVGAVLINPTDDVKAAVLVDGRIEFDRTPYDTASGASDAADGGSTNGWTYWFADTPDGLRTMASIREQLRGTTTESVEAEDRPGHVRGAP